MLTKPYSLQQHLNQEIINAFANGDPEAFRRVFDFYFPGLYFFSQKMIGNRDEAEEITMRTFRKLFKRCVHFNEAPDIRAFLYITARNTCMDYLRFGAAGKADEKVKMQNKLLLQLEYGIKYEMTETTKAAIGNISAECQKIFTMIYYDGLTPAAVAEILKIPVTTVLEQKRKAFQILGITTKE